MRTVSFSSAILAVALSVGAFAGWATFVKSKLAYGAETPLQRTAKKVNNHEVHVDPAVYEHWLRWEGELRLYVRLGHTQLSGQRLLVPGFTYAEFSETDLSAFKHNAFAFAREANMVAVEETSFGSFRSLALSGEYFILVPESIGDRMLFDVSPTLLRSTLVERTDR